MNILLTGQPKSGKSTTLQKVIGQVGQKSGFLTAEIKDCDKRTGFEVVDSEGSSAVIAKVDSSSEIRVAKYGVETEGFEELLKNLPEHQTNDLLYIDEIGEMQIQSDVFKDLVIKYLDSENTLLGTISAVYSDEFTENIKCREDVIVIEITPENRDDKAKYIQKLLGKIDKSKRYVSEKERFVIIGTDHVEMKSEHSTRTLKKIENHWTCSCDFYPEEGICSHSMAVKSIGVNF
jgi:nucleoside-triphosphatase